MWFKVVVGAAIAATLGALMIPIQSEARSVPKNRRVRDVAEPAPKPARPLSLLFVHHSVGDQLLLDHGPDGSPGKSSRGGGLRRLLEADGYRVHSATYGSELGEHTDLFDWPEKFRSQLDRLVRTAEGTKALPNDQRHDVVLFKSCFPNNELISRGEPPGNPQGPDLTVENAKAALRSILPEIQKQPDTLFVYLTIPPLAPKTYPLPAWKWAAKAVLGKNAAAILSEHGTLSRELNDWTVSPDGWLSGYPLKNVAVIDYYDILTNDGASNLLQFPSEDGSNSHPSAEGQRKAAPLVLKALNAAVERAGIAARAAAPQSDTTKLATGDTP